MKKLTLSREDIEQLLGVNPADANEIKRQVREESDRRGMLKLPNTLCWKNVFYEMTKQEEIEE